MPRASDLIGLPVLCGPGMRRIGRVQEVLFAPDGMRVAGLVLGGGGWFRPPRALDFQAVRAVGETCILAERESYLPPDLHHPPIRSLRGKPVLTGDGVEVGTMDDLHVDPATGTVTAVQLSRGMMDDLLSGKRVLTPPPALVLGEEAILMEDGAAPDAPGGA
jgi:uncharacterized protein YrrD